MPKVSVRFSESAVMDLETLKRWYAEQDVPDVGDRFVEEILARIEALREHPDMGRVVPEFDQPSLRELIHPPFRIVYRRVPKCVQIVRVWRSQRLLALPTDENRKPTDSTLHSPSPRWRPDSTKTKPVSID